MKKNLMSVIILALVFANFVLTALLMFTVLPETKKANKMIEDVCNAVDLELNSGAATGLSNTSIDKIKAYTVNGGEKMTMSFANGDDNKQHFLVVTDDHHTLLLRVEQQNDKAITTPASNALLGEYFRNRLGLPNGAYVHTSDLINYGRTDVSFIKIDDEQYYMDFSV